MSSLNSLTQLLQESGAQFRIFDMGRHLRKIKPSVFASVETGSVVYPTPYLHHAWLALLLWNPKEKEQSVVWFLKFPLDEQGYLVQAVRDDFINRLMININQMLQHTDLTQAEDALKDNPFSFTPDQEKMAVFHALMRSELHLAKSQYYDDCLHYFSGQAEDANWQALGIQGIAELAINIQDSQKSIAQNLPALADEPLIALCNCLEHSEISYEFSQQLFTRLKTCLAQAQSPALASSLMRAIQAGPNEALKSDSVLLLLQSPFAVKAEVIASIAVKARAAISNEAMMSKFLEALAIAETGQQGFSRILADLMFESSLRSLILSCFRNENRSSALSSCIGHMFGNAR